MATGFSSNGVTALKAAQINIATTSHNIGNAGTEGYSRQYAVQKSNTPYFTGSGFMGTGVHIETIRRAHNDFLERQLLAAESSAAELGRFGDLLGQVDNMLADAEAGISPTLQSFFATVNDLAATPNSVPARQAMLSAAKSLAARFRSTDQQLSEIGGGVNEQIRTEVITINSIVRQIAEVNERIIIAEGAARNQPANDLLDKRDQLIRDLNKEIRITVHTESDGRFSVFFGTGQPLVAGGQVYELQTDASREDLTQLNVALMAPNGERISLPQDIFEGGQIGGLLRFRSESLDEMRNSIGAVAASIINLVNTQHRLGQDLNGRPGGDFFQPLEANILESPDNTGIARLSASFVNSDYRLQYDGQEFVVTRLSDNRQTSYNSLPIVVDGVRFSLDSGSFAGQPGSPDVFLIRPGAAAADRVQALADNPGTAMLASSASNLQSLDVGEFRLQLIAANTMLLTRLSDGATWQGRGATQQEALADVVGKAAPLGVNIEIAEGVMQTGDSFLVRPSFYAARDMRVIIDDPTEIAAGMGVRSRSDDANGGTGAISNGEVVAINTPLHAPFSVRYEASSNSLVGFPAGSLVRLGDRNIKVADGLTRVPFAANTDYSVANVAFRIDGAPADGDVFTIDPRRSIDAANSGEDLFGVPSYSNQGNSVTASVALPTTINVVAGGLSLRLFINGQESTVTLPAGSYSVGDPAAAMDFANQLQQQMDAQIGANTVIVSVGGDGRLQLTSVNPQDSLRVGAAQRNSDAALSAGIDAAVGGGLPTAEFTLTYRQADAANNLPARLEGFPHGARVALTRPDGSLQEILIDPTDAAVDYVPFAANSVIEFNGMRFELSGAPVDGDRFHIGPNPSGVGDARNLLAIAELQTGNTMGGGTRNFQSSYAMLVSSIGNKAREIEVTLEAQESLAEQGREARESIAGVNLDEEAANLVRFQQHYQAAAKMLAISASLFEEVLSIAR